ncbi:MAG: type IV toxin-antitoxin system AbiEi family antitoxin [Propionibacteriaceae bacterium]|nr:type IV toxin-antitoxin system AbiEi family antitoxin [Propionibacteriaceae bacterium]
MNMTTAELQGAATKALAELGVRVAWHGTEQLLRISVGSQSRVLPYVIARGLRASKVGMLSSRMDRKAVVLSDIVSPAVGKKLREQGFQYMDTTGNARLIQDGLFVHIEGRDSRQLAPRRTPGLYTSGAMPVILALLVEPELIKAPLREIRTRAPVAQGTAHKVMREVRDGWVVESPADNPTEENKARWNRLLDGWVAEYERYRNSLVLGRYASTLPWPEVVEGLSGSPAMLSGEIAVHAADGELTPVTADLYAPDESDLGDGAQLVADEEGPIILRRQFWEIPESGEGLPVFVPWPVVYADLMATGQEQAQDAAREWRAQHGTL